MRRRLWATLAAVLGASLLVSACGGGDADDSKRADEGGAESFQAAGEGSGSAKPVLIIMTSKQPSRQLHIRVDLDSGESIAQSDFHSLDTAPVAGPGQTFGFGADSQGVELRCAPTSDVACGVRAFLQVVYAEQLTGALKVLHDSDEPWVRAVVAGKTTTLQPGNFTLP